MFDKEKYEKAEIKEQCKIYSQTEEGYIFVCSRKRYRQSVYKWKDYYFKFIPKQIKNIEDLKTTCVFEAPTDAELQTLLNLLQSKSTPGFPNKTVYTVGYFIWETFHPRLNIS